jgi:hypothetical protein
MVTFTLHGNQLSVSAGAPVALIEQALDTVSPDEEVEQPEEVAEAAVEAAQEPAQPTPRLWLKPLAISLAERGLGSFPLRDIDVSFEEDSLQVRGWPRIGGLRLVPINIMRGQVDNRDAAMAFRDEVAERKESLRSGANLLDYWGTWLAAGAALATAFSLWRHRGSESSA